MTHNWLSLNVQGMNSPQKRVKIFKYLKQQKIDIACLQETHFSTTSCPKYFAAHYPQIFLANASTKHRGVLIAISKTVPFICSKQIADPNGRYLILQGTVQDNEVTIMSYYAPNTNPGPFLTHVCSLLRSHQKGTLLLAGDSNVTLNPSLDKYPSDHKPPSAAAKSFSQSLQNCDLIDIWRELHPLSRDYTHYSHPHHSHSRIDHMFVLRKHLSLIESISILAAPWSDHDPILTVCHSLLSKPQFSPWVMNDSLLSQKEILADIHDASVEYFRINTGTVSSPVTLWEAYKAVLRGHVIRIASRRKKERAKAQRDLKLKLEAATKVFKQTPTPTNRKLLDKARTELDLCLTDEAERTLRWARQKWYIKANKPNAMLANRLRTFTPKFTPITLRTRHNSLTGNLQRVLEEFRHRLTKLYLAGSSFNPRPRYLSRKPIITFLV